MIILSLTIMWYVFIFLLIVGVVLLITTSLAFSPKVGASIVLFLIMLFLLSSCTV